MSHLIQPREKIFYASRNNVLKLVPERSNAFFGENSDRGRKWRLRNLDLNSNRRRKERVIRQANLISITKFFRDAGKDKNRRWHRCANDSLIENRLEIFICVIISFFPTEGRPVAELRTPCRPPDDKLRKFATERRRRRDGRRRYRSPRVFLNAPTVYICFGSERMGRADMRRACTHRGYCINGSASRRARRHVMREVTSWPRRRERQLLRCGEAYFETRY